MRSAGASSARDWLRSEFTGNRNDQTFTDLWHAATAIDFRLAQAGSEDAMTMALATDDQLELHLRRFGAYIYIRRTGDKVGGAHMLAVHAPGSSCDLAPEWLITETSAHSRAEFRVAEQVTKLTKTRGGGHDQDVSQRRGRGKGRGKDWGGGDDDGGKGGGRGKGRGRSR
jgi:hypothetical protein